MNSQSKSQAKLLLYKSDNIHNLTNTEEEYSSEGGMYYL
jgi:hypothetical protein